MENTGRTVRITFFAPAWDKPNMEKLRPPPLDRVIKGKQEYKNTQRRMAAGFVKYVYWQCLTYHFLLPLEGTVQLIYSELDCTEIIG